MGKQRIVLEHRIHIPLPGRQFAGRLTENTDGAAGELLETGNQPQAGGFTRTGGPQHREKFPIANAYANPIYGPHIAVQARYILKLDRVRHCLPPVLSGRPLSQYSPESICCRVRISRLRQPAFSRNGSG